MYISPYNNTKVCDCKFRVIKIAIKLKSSFLMKKATHVDEIKFNVYSCHSLFSVKGQYNDNHGLFSKEIDKPLLNPYVTNQMG
jgi:hypothetical protein